MIKLKLEKIKVSYGQNNIIDDISAQFVGGTMTAIIGKNGVGKTTLIQAIAQLIKFSGKVSLTDHGQGISKNCISYVPQISSVNTRLTVFEMVLLGLVNDLRWKVTKEQIERVSATLEELKLTSLSKQPFHTLSGGQKQLVSMAQSIIGKPKVLLLDEPTSALDLRHQLIVMDLAKEYTLETGAVTIFVVHDLMLASRYSDNMILLEKGRIKIQGQPKDVLQPNYLEPVYGVEVCVENNSLGFSTVMPIKPV